MDCWNHAMQMETAFSFKGRETNAEKVRDMGISLEGAAIRTQPEPDFLGGCEISTCTFFLVRSELENRGTGH